MKTVGAFVYVNARKRRRNEDRRLSDESMEECPNLPLVVVESLGTVAVQCCGSVWLCWALTCRYERRTKNLCSVLFRQLQDSRSDIFVCFVYSTTPTWRTHALGFL